ALWGPAHRGTHHKPPARPGRDVHSPRDGFCSPHQGWIFDGRWDASPLDQVRDFAASPELVWLNRWHVVPPLALAGLLLAFGGASAVVWGYCVSTVLLWHATYSINSLAHRWGTRRYDTADDSRNNWLLGLLNFVESGAKHPPPLWAAGRRGFPLVGVRPPLLRSARARGDRRRVGDPRASPPRGRGRAAARLRRLGERGRSASRREAGFGG